MEYSPSKLNTFLFLKLPSAFWSGVRVKSISIEKCVVTVKHRWFNQNPFNSMYFAVQAMAAELTTGALVITGGVGVGGAIIAGEYVTIGGSEGNGTLLDTIKSTFTTTSTSNVDTFSASVYRSARYVAQVVQGTDIHVAEIVIFHNGTNVYINEYGIFFNTAELGVFDAEYDAGTIKLKFTPANATSMTVTLAKTLITV